jgi:endonuclease VIII
MPEGHTIHRLARDLRSTLGDDVLEISSPQGRFADGAALLDGRRLLAAEAWGKYLFCDFGVGELLHVHLGLIGKFRRRPAPPPDPTGAVRLRIGGATATWDLSGPNRCELLTPDERDRITDRIGPDPLRPDADATLAVDRLRRGSRPIGAALLDQSVVAGVGNVYRAEILFLCGVHPDRACSSLDVSEAERVWAETVRLLRIGLRMNRIVTTDPEEVGRPRSRMSAEDRLYVYHREVCRRCGTAIATLPMGGRPIWFCPTCQPSPHGHAPRRGRKGSAGRRPVRSAT